MFIIYIKDVCDPHIHSYTYVQTTNSTSLTLCSSSMKSSGGRPTQARNTLTKASRCAFSALITGMPLGTSGALRRYDRSERTEWNRVNFESSAVVNSVDISIEAIEIRSHSSQRMTKSIINGVARSESSQVLCITIVFCIKTSKISVKIEYLYNFCVSMSLHKHY